MSFTADATDQRKAVGVNSGAQVPAASRDHEVVVLRGSYAHGEEAENAEAGDVRELFHTPVLRRVTLCL